MRLVSSTACALALPVARKMKARQCRICGAEVKVQRLPRSVVFSCISPDCDWKATKVKAIKGG